MQIISVGNGPRADPRFEAIRLLLDELPRIRLPARGDNLRVRRVTTRAVLEVLLDGLVEEHDILRHDGDRPAEMVHVEVLNLVAVDQDRAGVLGVEALPVDPLVSIWGVERGGEFSPLVLLPAVSGPAFWSCRLTRGCVYLQVRGRGSVA